MKCHWDAYIKLLPQWLREPVNRLGKDTLTELRLRIGQAPQLVLLSRSLWLERVVTKEDITFCVNAASQYSPWAARTAAKGYITTPGGHRIGICGDGIVVNEICTGFDNITSLCIRVARDIPNLADELREIHESTLLIGAPGSGKTTLLRDLVRQQSNMGPGSIAVLDERGELFPIVQGVSYFTAGRRTDILTGCPKAQGIPALIRSMGPSAIAVDEITAEEDCTALIQAGWCGVRLFATAHAYNREDLFHRPVYKPLMESGLFKTLIVLQQDKTWRRERMKS